jgi:hypothetical protein
MAMLTAILTPVPANYTFSELVRRRLKYSYYVKKTERGVSRDLTVADSRSLSSGSGLCRARDLNSKVLRKKNAEPVSLRNPCRWACRCRPLCGAPLAT